MATLQARARLIAETEALIGKEALVAYPTLPCVAPAIEPLRQDDDKFFAANGRSLRNTQIGNFLDWCGVTIPCGTDQPGCR